MDQKESMEIINKISLELVLALKRSRVLPSQRFKELIEALQIHKGFTLEKTSIDKVIAYWVFHIEGAFGRSFVFYKSAGNLTEVGKKKLEQLEQQYYEWYMVIEEMLQPVDTMV